MQKRRNIKLFVILLLLLAGTVIAYFFTLPKDKINVDRDIFSFQDPSQIDRIRFKGAEELTLSYDGRLWKVNDEYEADKQRISVLFAILKQTKIRRRVASAREDAIANRLEEEGTHVIFYQGNDEVMDFHVWGDTQSKITYVSHRLKDDVYIVEIPGYRNFLAGIYQLDANGWRNPRVFDFSWSNLQDVKVKYQDKPAESFSVIYDGDFYQVPEVGETDSVRLTDFLDDLSLLYVNDYLNANEVDGYKDIFSSGPLAVVKVEDVANNVYTLEIYGNLDDSKEILGRIDSTEYALFDRARVRRVLRPRHFFLKKKG